MAMGASAGTVRGAVVREGAVLALIGLTVGLGLAYAAGRILAAGMDGIAIVILVFIGSSAPGATSVFFFSDPLMGVLALVNLLTIIMLFPVGLRVLNDYREQLDQGKEHPVFDPDKFPDLDIDKSAWTMDAPATSPGND